MNISERLGIRKNDVLSVVGAGGKTTLIFRLANELRAHRVLVATTTKMYLPKPGEYDYIYINEPPNPAKGINFLSGIPDADNKATCYGGLRSVLRGFDYTLIEADGAKGKLLKGWSEGEPVVIPETTKTLGVLNLKLLGERVTPENIHRIDKYMELTGSKAGDVITIPQLERLVERGLFKNSAGERILCVIDGEGKAGYTLKATSINSKRNGYEEHASGASCARAAFLASAKNAPATVSTNRGCLKGADKCIIL